MKMLKAFLVLLSILAFSCSATLAQGVSEAFCKNIGNSTIQLLKPTKIYRQLVFENDCDFSYGFNNSAYEHISIDVEKHKSDRESGKAFNHDLEMFLYNKQKGDKRIMLDSKNWDEMYLYKSAHHDNFLLLRKRNFYALVVWFLLLLR